MNTVFDNNILLDNTIIYTVIVMSVVFSRGGRGISYYGLQRTPYIAYSGYYYYISMLIVTAFNMYDLEHSLLSRVHTKMHCCRQTATFCFRQINNTRIQTRVTNV